MRLNYGTVFKRIDTVDLVTDVWMQTFLIKLPIVNVSTLTVEKIDCTLFGDPTGCTHFIDLLQFLHNASIKAVKHIDRAIQHIHQLLPSALERDDMYADRRQQRGLFDFVGEISHSLFGTARDTDIESVHKTIADLKRREHTMASAWQHAEDRLASYGEVVNHRLDTMNKMVSTEKQAIRDLYDTVARETSAVSRASSLLAHAFNRFEDFVILLDHLHDFQNGLELLNHGMLSPSIISPGDLNRAISAVATHLRFLPEVTLRILRPRVRSYYTMHNFLLSRHGNNILLHLPIPLGILPTHLYLFQVHTVPLSTPGSLPHATILTGVPKYLAYHPSSPYFLEFDELPQVSPSKLLFLDHTSAVLQSVNQPSCLMKILKDNVSSIPLACKFAVATNSIKPQILSLDRQHVLLINVSHVTIRCHHEPERNISCAATCRVTLPCRCILVSEFIFVPGRMEGCFPGRRPLVLHNVNLPLLQHFFNESQLKEIYGNTLLPDPLRVFVPSLKIFEANFSHELQADKVARFDLARIVNLTKHDKQAYASLAHSMVDDWTSYASGSFDRTFSLFSWKSWCIIVVGLLAIVSFGWVLLLSYKLKILAASVTALSLTPRIHAIPAELTYFSSTANPVNQSSIFHFIQVPVDWTLDVTVILLLILITLVIAVKAFKRHQKSLYQFDLFLHVGIDTSSCVIWLKSFQLEPSCYHFTADTFVESLEVIGIIFPRLLLSWPSLRIRSEVTNESYYLPKTVSISWKQASFLRQTLRQPYWCVFVTKTNDGQSMITLPIRDWQAAPSYGDMPRAVSMVTLKTNASAPALYPSIDEATSSL